MGKRKKDQPRIIPEQDGKICGTICICQMIIVLSCVSFVYLGVAIYVPSHKAFNSGIHPEPLMCDTVNDTLSKNCSWASCGEWCLTKTSGTCPQFYARVRQNGTEMALKNCARLVSVSCPPVNEDSISKKFNCNNNTECGGLTGIFRCRLGHCKNLSEIYDCRHSTTNSTIVRSDVDNLKLNGLFDCHKARCTLIKPPLNCDRYCNKITTTTMNVYLKYDDNLYTAECEKALAFNVSKGNLPSESINATEIWTERKSGGALFASCTNVYRVKQDELRAIDCVDGTILPHNRIPQPFMNFSQFWTLYDGSKDVLDKQQRFLPMWHQLTIYNSSKLFINLEGCVNTLRGECKEFTRTHGRNGTGNTAMSRFPCYYNQNNSEFVVARFDLNKTWLELMIGVCVPGSLFLISFVTLMIITQTVRVGDDARMRCKWCADVPESDDVNLDVVLAIGKNGKTKNAAASIGESLPMKHLDSASSREMRATLLDHDESNA